MDTCCGWVYSTKLPVIPAMKTIQIKSQMKQQKSLVLEPGEQWQESSRKDRPFNSHTSEKGINLWNFYQNSKQWGGSEAHKQDIFIIVTLLIVYKLWPYNTDQIEAICTIPHHSAIHYNIQINNALYSIDHSEELGYLISLAWAENYWQLSGERARTLKCKNTF